MRLSGHQRVSWSLTRAQDLDDSEAANEGAQPARGLPVAPGARYLRHVARLLGRLKLRFSFPLRSTAMHVHATLNRITMLVAEGAKAKGLPLQPFIVHDLRRTGSTP